MPAENITKGFEIDKGRYVEINQDEIDAIALESTRTIEIDEFVPRTEIDDLYISARITSRLTAKWDRTPSP